MAVDGKLKHVVDTLDLLSSVMPCPAYILDVDTENIIYASTYPLFVGGYSTIEAKSSGKKFFTLISAPEDRIFIEGVFEKIDEFYNKVSLEKAHNFSISFNCSIIAKNGEHVMVNHQIVPLHIGENRVKIVFGMIFPAVHSRGHDLSARDKHCMSRWQYDFRKKKWDEDKRLQLTDFEKLILTYSFNVMSIKEISEKTNKSEDTVKGYRKSIFKKLGVNSIAGILTFTLTHKLLI